MNALVEQTEFGITTSSRTVAEVFEKEHRSVLATIDDILAKRPDRCAQDFMRTSVMIPMPNGGEREVRSYEMTHDGFTLVAMGFTGIKALDFKIAYIEEFNRMEAELAHGRRSVPGTPAGGDPVSVLRMPRADHNRFLAHVALVTRLYGVEAGRWAYEQLRLPTPPAHTIVTLPERAQAPAGCYVPASVEQWAEFCIRRDRDKETHSAALYANYEEWCESEDLDPETRTAFGRALSAMGFERKKSASGNILRRGLVLLHP